MEIININGEEYISLTNIDRYLDDPNVVCKLKYIYFRFKGFATIYTRLVEPVMNSNILDINCYFDPITKLTPIRSKKDKSLVFWEEGEDVYINGLIEYSIQDIIEHKFSRDDLFADKTVYIALIERFLGTKNGEEHTLTEGSFLYSINTEVKLTLPFREGAHCFAKLSDLDALAEKYGIPKKSAALPISENCNQLTVPPEKSGIKKYLPPQAPNRKSKAMKQGIDAFEEEHHYTPEFYELFRLLLTMDFTELGVKYTQKSKKNDDDFDYINKINAKAQYKDRYPQ